MEWADDGILLGTRKHGETGTIATLFTRDHGRHLGIVHGGVGRRARGIYQSGNLLAARWRGRLSEHLGSWNCEIRRSFMGDVLDDPFRLAALTSACAVTDAAFPERQPHLRAYLGFVDFLQSLATPEWPCVYVQWELLLLSELGYGLDLGNCAATGVTTGLCYVSPKSGRAVSAAAGEPYGDRLLPLPAFLIEDDAPWDGAAIQAGLALTGYFLARHVFVGRNAGKLATGGPGTRGPGTRGSGTGGPGAGRSGAGEPAARSRFLACMVAMTTGSGVKGADEEQNRHL